MHTFSSVLLISLLINISNAAICPNPQQFGIDRRGVYALNKANLSIFTVCSATECIEKSNKNKITDEETISACGSNSTIIEPTRDKSGQYQYEQCTYTTFKCMKNYIFNNIFW